MKLVRQTIALVLLLAFAASHTALLPALLASGAWLGDEHEVRLVPSQGHLDVVLSHHDGKSDAAKLPESIHHEHRHGWTTSMLVALADAPVPDGDHVIHFTLSGQIATSQVSAALPVAVPTVELCPPTIHLVTLTTLPVIAPVHAARPPPLSQLLLALRTTVLVV